MFTFNLFTQQHSGIIIRRSSFVLRAHSLFKIFFFKKFVKGIQISKKFYQINILLCLVTNVVSAVQLLWQNIGNDKNSTRDTDLILKKLTTLLGTNVRKKTVGNVLFEDLLFNTWL